MASGGGGGGAGGDEDGTAAEVQAGRKAVLEAAAVRIMKSRKELSHAELVNEVMRQTLLFHPTGRDVKAVIEGLIEREFLERVEGSANTYRYLA